MPSNDREVWVAIVSGNGDAPELNYLTYAIYSFEKYEWFDQTERAKGKPPTAGEINDWIVQITETRIKAWRESAARTFDLAARTYMRDEVTRERQAAVEDRLISTVKVSLDSFSKELGKSGSLWRQIIIGFFIAILSPIILGVIILALQAADRWPTPGGVAQSVGGRPPAATPSTTPNPR